MLRRAVAYSVGNRCNLCLSYQRYVLTNCLRRDVRLLSNLAEKLDVLSDFSCHIKPLKSKSGSSGLGKIPNKQISEIISALRQNDLVRELAYEQGMSNKIFETCITKFQQYLVESSQLPEEIELTLNDIAIGQRSADDIFPYFLQHSQKIYPILMCFSDLQKISNLTNPAYWYPKAREMKRKIVFHAGPTNSGKTYEATQAFFQAEKGLYAAPLRLLATEIYKKCDEMGVPCDLITGEHQRFVNEDRSFCGHVACTVEMANLEQVYDSVVIDEIQLLRDEQRGYAWTRALLGLPSREVHVCGEPAAVNLVKQLAETCGDEFQVQSYERLTPLCFEDFALQSWREIEKGDCIIAFSRTSIFKVTAELEKLGVKYATIYGALPPATKIEQARVFNDPESGVDVLVASDAIGMGINLSIRRIIFYSMDKFTRNNAGILTKVKVPQHLALQIAGRAGRYGSAYDFGYVTAFGESTLRDFKEIASQPIGQVEKAGIAPTFDQLQMFAYHLPEYTLKNLIEIFNLIAQIDKNFFVCPSFEFKEIANLLEEIDLPLEAKFKFCIAPANVTKVPFLSSLMLKFAQSYSRGQAVRCEMIKKLIKWPIETPKTRAALDNLESVNEGLELYLWLSYRFPTIFDDQENVTRLMIETSELIEEGLETLKLCNLNRGAAMKAKQETPRRRKKLSSSLKELKRQMYIEQKPNDQEEVAQIHESNSNKTEKQQTAIIGDAKSKAEKFDASHGDSWSALDPLNSAENNIAGRKLSTPMVMGKRKSDEEESFTSLAERNLNTNQSVENGMVQSPSRFDRHQIVTPMEFRQERENLGYPADKVYHRVNKRLMSKVWNAIGWLQTSLVIKRPSARLLFHVDFFLNIEVPAHFDRVTLYPLLSQWHQLGLVLWFMKKYPQTATQVDNLNAKWISIGDALRPYFGSQYLEEFSFNMDPIEPSKNVFGTRLMGSCLKRCRKRLAFYGLPRRMDSRSSLERSADILPITISWLQSKVKREMETNVEGKVDFEAAIDDAIEFLGIMHKLSPKVFADCRPAKLAEIREQLHKLISVSNEQNESKASSLNYEDVSVSDKNQKTEDSSGSSILKQFASYTRLLIKRRYKKVEGLNDGTTKRLEEGNSNEQRTLRKLLSENRISQEEYETILAEMNEKR